MFDPASYYKIGRRLTLRYPEIARQLLNDAPIQNDIIGQLPAIYQQFINLHRETPGGANSARLEFVTVILMYADPEVFTTKKKLMPGVRAELAELFNCDPSQISHVLKNAKDYLTIYQEFKERIKYLYSELFES